MEVIDILSDLVAEMLPPLDLIGHARAFSL
jgi:hypothetical protein